MEIDSEIQRLRSRNSDLEGKLLDARRREVDMTETSRLSNARQMELASPLSLDTDQEELHDALHNVSYQGSYGKPGKLWKLRNVKGQVS